MKLFTLAEEYFTPAFLRKCKNLIFFFIVYTLIFWFFIKTLGYSIPFLIAVGLAFMVQPLIRFCVEELRIKRSIASFFITTIILVIFLGLIFLAFQKIITEIIYLINYLSSLDYGKIVLYIQQWLSYLNITEDSIIKTIENNTSQLLHNLSSQTGSMLKWTLAVFTSIPVWIMMITVIIFCTFFFARDIYKIRNLPARVLSLSMLQKLDSLRSHGKNMLGKYILAYVKLIIITFFLSLILYVSLGINYALVLGLVTAIADLLPIIGPGAVFITLAVLSYLNGNTFAAIALLVGWLVISAIRQVMESKLVSDSIDVHPVTMIAILFIGLKAGSFILIFYLMIFAFLWKVLNKVGSNLTR